LIEENKEYAMKQLQKYIKKHHHIYQTYLQSKGFKAKVDRVIYFLNIEIG